MKYQLPVHLFIFFFSLLFFLPFDLFGQFSIEVNATCIAGGSIEVGYYYGSKTLLKDTILIDQQGSSNKVNLDHEGLYFILLPDTSIYEFLVTGGDHYQITINKINNKFICNLNSNPIAAGYDNYSKEFSIIVQSIDSLKAIQVYNSNQTIKEKLDAESKKINALRTQYISQFNGTFLECYLQAIIPVDFIGKNTKSEFQNTDSMQFMTRYKYYQEHYLDNINFNEERLIYTPVFAEKINTYLDKKVQQKPVSITSAIDNMLKRSENKNVIKFILEELIKKYGLTHSRPLDEYVYAYLLDHYYLKGYATWLSDKQIDLLSSELNKIKPALLLQPAPEINLPGPDRKIYSLHKITSENTVLVFWDLDCPACRRIMQELRSSIIKYNYLNLKVYTVYTNNNIALWQDYISVNLPESWINTHEIENHRSMIDYNITHTPTIFLLDMDKIIIDKNLTVKELDSFFLKIALQSNK
jgi:thiol-disulfide isomerase/thioredoxin